MISGLREALEGYAGPLIGLSALATVIGLVLVPVLIVRVPEDYFLCPHRDAARSPPGRRCILRFAVSAAKNLLGALLLVTGFVLLFLPAEGLLTLLTGLLLMNYPGKYEFERWLVRRPLVLPAMNWLRNRYGRAPLKCP